MGNSLMDSQCRDIRREKCYFIHYFNKIVMLVSFQTSEVYLAYMLSYGRKWNCNIVILVASMH